MIIIIIKRNQFLQRKRFGLLLHIFCSVVCLSIVRQSHLCTLLKPFDEFWCHLACSLRLWGPV